MSEMIKTNKEFTEVAKIEVKQLNGAEADEAIESWKSGYNYARQIISDKMKTMSNSEFMEFMEDFVYTELEEFNF